VRGGGDRDGGGDRGTAQCRGTAKAGSEGANGGGDSLHGGGYAALDGRCSNLVDIFSMEGGNIPRGAWIYYHCYTVSTLINHCYTLYRHLFGGALINHCYTISTLINHCHAISAIRYLH
jgi:hypothetical protein